MKPVAMKRLLQVVALYNVAAALPLLIQPLYSALGLYPAPDHLLYLHLNGLLFVVFGIGYWLASYDVAANWPVIRLGLLSKVGVFALVMSYTGSVHPLMTLLACGDLLFATLFFRLLWQIRSHHAGYQEDKAATSQPQ